MIRELTYEEIPGAYEDFILPFFPRNEVKPLGAIQAMHREGCYKVLALTEEDRPGPILGCAFITIHPGGHSCLLDYYAIDQQMRSRGLGSQMLQEMVTGVLAGCPVMIETEMVELAKSEEQRAERIRRNAFYERNGAKKTDLITLIYGVYYNIWLLGEAQGISVTEEMEKCYRYMVAADKYEENCTIPASLPLQTDSALV